ncbi:MAG TPA: hypothetical protein VJ698_11760 [Noviherbaspirillum sp.]|uniref:hypothetical protein n=1 Tax=Noviherbaspirillum sp. TaxID=1926288 RepID=UPI002B491ACB|nr:hypothetical protein [Noviherbaspirillum sp.]HJV86139.1 hypothetical protein [Noviherbaspirillum sp.]
MSRELEKLRGTFFPVEQSRTPETRVPAPMPRPSGFFTFRYSSTEIYSEGGKLHVKMTETRYQDGRLKSEECEGTLERDAYERMVSEAQGYFLNQMTNFVRLFYLPFSRGRRHDE